MLRIINIIFFLTFALTATTAYISKDILLCTIALIGAFLSISIDVKTYKD